MFIRTVPKDTEQAASDGVWSYANNANDGTRNTEMQEDSRYTNRKDLNMHYSEGVPVSWTFCVSPYDFSVWHVLKRKFLFKQTHLELSLVLQVTSVNDLQKATRSHYQQMALSSAVLIAPPTKCCV